MRFSLAIGVFAFAYLAWGCSPAWFWLDSGEISAAAVEQGVMHPPGAPGLMAIFHIFGGLPLGNLAFRIALGSSFLAAASIGFQADILRIREVRPWIIVLMAIGCLGSWTFLRNARVAEIYSFAAFLLMVSIWGFCRAGSQSRSLSYHLIGLMAAAWAMIGFGDLRLALGVGIVVYGLKSIRRAEAWCIWAPWALAMASLVLLSIPLSSARHPVCDWGDPDSWWRLWDHIHAKSIRAAFSARMWPNSWELWKGYTGRWIELVFQDLGLIAPFVLIIAIGVLWRRRVSRSFAAWLTWLIAVEMFYAIAVNPMGIRDRQNSMVITLLSGLTIGVALEGFLQHRSRYRSMGALAVVCLMVVIPFFTNHRDAQNTQSWMPHSWTRSVFAQLPPGALLLTQTDDLAAGAVAARVIEGARPDILSVPAQHLYRKVPDRALYRQDTKRLWELVAQGDTDFERISVILDRWSSPVALEFPSILLFSGLEWRDSGGEPPIEIRNRAKRPGVFEGSLRWWTPQLEGAMDRDRLARALDAYIRQFRQKTKDSEQPLSERLRRVAWMYSEILRHVDDGHVSSMLNLAVMLHASGQREQAIELTREAVKLDPLRVSGIVQLVGFLAHTSHEQAEVRNLARQAIDLSAPNFTKFKILSRVCKDVELGECDSIQPHRLTDERELK